MLCVVDDMTRELEIDSVTETYTREGFFRRTNKIIKRNTQQEFAIMYLNLVDFKIINDLYGYEICEKNVESGIFDSLQIFVGCTESRIYFSD